MRHRRL
jgi:hypothetical protein